MTLRLISLLILTLSSSSNARADDNKLPRIELGISSIGLHIPDYRGSASSRKLFFPAPYVRYRSKKLKVDNGIQGIFLDSKNLVLSISGGGSLPVDGDNPERDGMNELKATLEIGPSLDYRLYQGKRSEFWLELPIRIAFTLESNPEHVGEVFEPRLVWLYPSRRQQEWKLRFATGPLYASNQRHDYFYAVDLNEVRANRPAYDAESGFSGIRSDFTYGRRIGSYWFGGFLRYDSLKNAVVTDSPLVSETSTWLAGLVFSWVFSETY